MSAIEGEGTGSARTTAYQLQIPSPSAQEMAAAAIQLQPARPRSELALAFRAEPTATNEATSSVPTSSTQVVAVGPAGLKVIHSPKRIEKTRLPAQANRQYRRVGSREMSTK